MLSRKEESEKFEKQMNEKLICYSNSGQAHNPNKCVIQGVTLFEHNASQANEESGELKELHIQSSHSLGALLTFKSFMLQFMPLTVTT